METGKAWRKERKRATGAHKQGRGRTHGGANESTIVFFLLFILFRSRDRDRDFDKTKSTSSPLL
jgi:hypothetical protein